MLLISISFNYLVISWMLSQFYICGFRPFVDHLRFFDIYAIDDSCSVEKTNRFIEVLFERLGHIKGVIM